MLSLEIYLLLSSYFLVYIQYMPNKANPDMRRVQFPNTIKLVGSRAASTATSSSTCLGHRDRESRGNKVALLEVAPPLSLDGNKRVVINLVWDNLLKRQGCSVVNLFPREVSRVLNLFPKELIEGPPKEFPKAKNLYSEQVNRMESHSANVCPRVLCG